MPSRTYRLEVEGQVIGHPEWSLQGMSLSHYHGNTIFVGPVRDQAELHGLLQRFSDLGLTIISIEAIDGGWDN